MICEILSVGTELLMGQIANTDAQFLARRLSMLGITMHRQTTVGDNPGRVKEALREALSRADLVITTGGLGPTEDDLTKEMVAETFGLPMEVHGESLERIRAFFTSIGREMAANNAKQAMIPRGARVMPNRKGTAPGCIIEAGGKIVAILPGPPFELIDMYEQQLEPYLLSLSDSVIASRFLHIVGVGESEVETRLLDLFHSDSPTLALYCNPGEVTARLTVMCRRDEDPAPLLDPVDREIRRRMGSAVYAEGIDVSLPKEIVRRLAERGETLAVAESLTGGMLASQIVDVPGASRVFLEGCVSYATEVKRRALGVPQAVLDADGPVSEACARAMAEGALRISGASWALATTGLAGPGGGTPETPVGTVFVALAGSNMETRVKRFQLRSDRPRVRAMSCLYALNLLRLRLDEMET
ncbi:MAG: competence/damage-inducible protein A [Clostridia bacterium]|nr:competence/damage-inducible protein A [Clostridia bacterium]MBO4884780.1 competence/damage-inducible protein A [Clostridia bacterium]